MFTKRQNSFIAHNKEHAYEMAIAEVLEGLKKDKLYDAAEQAALIEELESIQSKKGGDASTMLYLDLVAMKKNQYKQEESKSSNQLVALLSPTSGEISEATSFNSSLNGEEIMLRFSTGFAARLIVRARKLAYQKEALLDKIIEKAQKICKREMSAPTARLGLES